MKIEAGERYFTRDGRLSDRVLNANHLTMEGKFSTYIGEHYYIFGKDGCLATGSMTNLDLVRKAVRGVDYNVKVKSDNRPDIVKSVSDSLAYAQRIFEHNSIAGEKEGANARETILDEAKKAVGDRGLNYGKPEENWDRIANLWNAYLLTKQDKALYAEDVACMMILMKVARLQNTPHHKDSWVDIAGYAACGGSLKEKGDE